MKKLKLTLAAIFMTACFANAQSTDTKTTSELSAEQKGFLATTWYEQPKESNGNTVVYRLTEYKLVAGQDFYGPPTKITLANSGNFNGENIKVGKAAESAESNSGKWKVSGNTITLDFGKQKNKLSIVSIEKDKLVLKAE